MQAQQLGFSWGEPVPLAPATNWVQALCPVSCLLASATPKMGWALTCRTVETSSQTLTSVMPAERNRAQDGLPPEVQDYLEMIELQDSQPLDLNPRHGVRWE